MYFLLLEDSRTPHMQNAKIIIAKHEDKQALEGFYKSLLVHSETEPSYFAKDSVLAPFIVPKEDDPNVIVEWSEAGWVEAIRRDAANMIEQANKLNAEAEQLGKQKWDSIVGETFTPAELLEGFAKAQQEQQGVKAEEAATEAPHSLEATSPETDVTEAPVADLDGSLAIAQADV